MQKNKSLKILQLLKKYRTKIDFRIKIKVKERDLLVFYYQIRI